MDCSHNWHFLRQIPVRQEQQGSVLVTILKNFYHCPRCGAQKGEEV